MIIHSGMPDVIATIKLEPQEFCYHVYMPVKVGNKHFILPDNLLWVEPLLDSILDTDWDYTYWYLTVKHMWVDGYGNREGWHIDGFGTDDINYIWSDCLPTEFANQAFVLSEDHNLSLKEMQEQATEDCTCCIRPNQLVRLDTTMVHRPVKSDKPVLRTFIKVSCSNHQYNLKGNATNPNLQIPWDNAKVERKLERNHPIGS